MALVLSFGGKSPQIDETAFVAPNATLVGDVTLGPEASVWFSCVVRGDVHPIRIGARANIQDLTMVHVRTRRYATIIEDDVTVGHSVTLHGCTLRRRSLIGIGAVVLDAAEIGEESIIGAGSVVTPGTVIPPRVLAFGAPCKVKRELTAEEIAGLADSALRYAELAAAYRAELGR